MDAVAEIIDAVVARRLAAVRRRTLLGVALALLVGLPGLALAAGRPAAPAQPPKVVVIVGPAGPATDLYRRLGREAAETARRTTPDVTEIVSPNATWPLVRDALQGANLVVYLGHGNGWPSPYRDRPFPQTQNGLGLNPVAGGDDDAHQYFGEAYLRDAVRLAPGAVVVLSHLCYASGNSEPGDPEPTRDVAIQRTDNFAAGWLAIGADAVIADAELRPAFYVGRLLDGRFSTPRIWLGAPNAHGHTLAVASARTPGAAVLLDPDDPAAGGWFRSLVTRSPGTLPGVAWLGGPVDASGGPSTLGDPLTAAFRPGGAPIAAPEIVGDQAPAGTSITVRLPIGWRAPLDVLASARWIPIELDPPATPGDEPSSAVARSPDGSPPSASAAPAPSPASPSVVLVAPEAPSQVVEPVEPVADADGLRIDAEAPTEPGHYRLVVTLHRPDGTALPAEVQARIPSSLVRVTGRVSVTFALPATLEAYAGQVVPVPVAVRNTGSFGWGGDPNPAAEVTPRSAPEPPRLVATWIGLESPWPTRVAAGRAIGPLAPGEETSIVLLLRAPDVPGPYLLLIDVDTPDHGSLVAAGSEPGTTRIVVLDRSAVPAAPNATPEDRAAASSG